ncbi:hypothetical protein PHYBLDRAFT_164417 [Phycomyces blakesleeanus NRRL 1555(-)]|uniref:Uncharacterized protein n=1 Tax=Phycomyces blakesleeanus (strain ATCC 8743b / DSM 1359 / FGSC 10004 / NBRC 33097 / NRRL 1555) TaxID=763407 RepID=A0A167P9A6_PHYB8|nr:hypothetical protein PHYBLDRAFT_164417 [Phycomyces blakesleeanus NRRL 1555(-)]OAD77508.1 hypothetical protein PHYBLDRAFT_164417 [Phycomyces blakesleeanus NRRL 1555(-)]|eukprot:XP_018295548.1 hypothetical protein PHYBLDRAFT_164417 [Phycomyces blakesleeanus NRRL 1555(-)]
MFRFEFSGFKQPVVFSVIIWYPPSFLPSQYEEMGGFSYYMFMVSILLCSKKGPTLQTNHIFIYFALLLKVATVEFNLQNYTNIMTYYIKGECIDPHSTFITIFHMRNYSNLNRLVSQLKRNISNKVLLKCLCISPDAEPQSLCYLKSVDTEVIIDRAT